MTDDFADDPAVQNARGAALIEPTIPHQLRCDHETLFADAYDVRPGEPLALLSHASQQSISGVAIFWIEEINQMCTQNIFPVFRRWGWDVEVQIQSTWT